MFYVKIWMEDVWKLTIKIFAFLTISISLENTKNREQTLQNSIKNSFASHLPGCQKLNFDSKW